MVCGGFSSYKCALSPDHACFASHLRATASKCVLSIFVFPGADFARGCQILLVIGLELGDWIAMVVGIAVLGRPDFAFFMGKHFVFQSFGQNRGTPKRQFLPPWQSNPSAETIVTEGKGFVPKLLSNLRKRMRRANSG